MSDAFEAAGLARLPAWMTRTLAQDRGHQWWRAVDAARSAPVDGPVVLSGDYWSVRYEAGGGDVLTVLAAFFPGRVIDLHDAGTGRAECGLVPA